MGARILVVDDSPTIRKVVCQILATREFETVTAFDGVDALEKLEVESVDLVLVDFVMPRMNGYQLCRQLRQDARHARVPVVLMSAKGDKIRGQFVQQTGAADAITKPFDGRGLIAVIEAVLAKAGQNGERSPLEALRDEEIAVESGPVSLGAFDRLAQERHGGKAAALLAPQLAKELRLPEERVREALLSAFTNDALMAIAEDLSVAQLGGRADALSGDVAVVSIAEVLQLIQMQRLSGTLTIAAAGREVELSLGEGLVDLATARSLGGEFLLGRYLIEVGALDRDGLPTAVQAAREAGAKLGVHLVQVGKVAEQSVTDALRRQTAEIVYELVRWSSGRFVFAPGEPRPGVRLGVPPHALVMEGFRRVDEWRLIEGSFDFDEVLERAPGALERAKESKLTRLEQELLGAIDGERTVREITAEISGSSFEVCKIIYQLVNSRFVRRRAASSSNTGAA